MSLFFEPVALTGGPKRKKPDSEPAPVVATDENAFKELKEALVRILEDDGSLSLADYYKKLENTPENFLEVYGELTGFKPELLSVSVQANMISESKASQKDITAFRNAIKGKSNKSTRKEDIDEEERAAEDDVLQNPLEDILAAALDKIVLNECHGLNRLETDLQQAVSSTTSVLLNEAVEILRDFSNVYIRLPYEYFFDEKDEIENLSEYARYMEENEAGEYLFDLSHYFAKIVCFDRASKLFEVKLIYPESGYTAVGSDDGNNIKTLRIDLSPSKVKKTLKLWKKFTDLRSQLESEERMDDEESVDELRQKWEAWAVHAVTCPLVEVVNNPQEGQPVRPLRTFENFLFLNNMEEQHENDAGPAQAQSVEQNDKRQWNILRRETLRYESFLQTHFLSSQANDDIPGGWTNNGDYLKRLASDTFRNVYIINSERTISLVVLVLYSSMIPENLWMRLVKTSTPTPTQKPPPLPADLNNIDNLLQLVREDNSIGKVSNVTRQSRRSVANGPVYNARRAFDLALQARESTKKKDIKPKEKALAEDAYNQAILVFLTVQAVATQEAISKLSIGKLPVFDEDDEDEKFVDPIDKDVLEEEFSEDGDGEYVDDEADEDADFVGPGTREEDEDEVEEDEVEADFVDPNEEVHSDPEHNGSETGDSEVDAEEEKKEYEKVMSHMADRVDMTYDEKAEYIQNWEDKQTYGKTFLALSVWLENWLLAVPQSYSNKPIKESEQSYDFDDTWRYTFRHVYCLAAISKLVSLYEGLAKFLALVILIQQSVFERAETALEMHGSSGWDDPFSEEEEVTIRDKVGELIEAIRVARAHIQQFLTDNAETIKILEKESTREIYGKKNLLTIENSAPLFNLIEGNQAHPQIQGQGPLVQIAHEADASSGDDE
jgi:hypothetical protein